MNFFHSLKVVLILSVSLLSFDSSWAASLFNITEYIKCKEPLIEFLTKNAKLPLESILSKQWDAKFVVNPDLPLSTIYSLRNRGSVQLIELHSAQNRMTIALSTEQGQLVSEMDLKTCEVKLRDSIIYESESKTSASFSSQFQDEDLNRIMVENKKGVIYFWSPYMFLSVQGISKIEKVCKELGIKLTVLLDPHASMEDAQEALIRFQLKREHLRKNYSKKLQETSPRLHYPNIVLYRDKLILHSNLSGYKSSTAYLEFIQRYIGSRDE